MGNFSLARAGFQQPFTVAQPAAGAEWTFTVPTALNYRLEVIFFTLTTSATVANRGPRVQFKDGSGNVIWETSIAGLAASGTYRFGYARLGPDSINTGSGNTSALTLPDVWLPGGYVIATNTANKDSGDQFSAVNGIVSVATGT